MLRLNGYSTGAFGKWHETPAWEISASGPFDRWPTHQGFDKFYGFLGGETNQWAPFLYDGVTQVELPNDPNYHFMTDMTEKARAWIKYQKVLTPDRPAFVYFAPGATHAPHHVPKDWIAKWKGKFDQGWDKLREETLARQIKMGIVPPDTRLAPKPPAIKDWDTLSADEQRLFARQAEVFAAFADYTDHEIGRLLEAFAEVGEADNTLVFYMVVSWPKAIKAKNEIRTQFGHVIDVAPTILQAIGLPEPKVVNGTLFVNDEKVAEGRIANTQAGMFSADETADVGIDLGTPVVEAIGSEARSRFTGRIPKVTVAVQ
jgi:arylsulfatase A-like enzyme